MQPFVLKMRNHTSEFTELVKSYSKELGIKPKEQVQHVVIDDTFISEAVDLFRHVSELRKLLLGVKDEYLLSSYSHKGEGMTEEERDEVDSHARVELRKDSERLAHLKNYETKRSKSKQFFAFNKGQASAVNNFRNGVLSSLNFELEETSRLLLEMQETRLSRKRDIDLTDFNSNTMKVDDRYTTLLLEEAESQRLQDELEELPKEQVMLLETENGEILDAKLEELAKVEQIQNSVVEIAQLHSQLSSYLQLQSESIRSLCNEQDLIEMDVSEAGKQLRKATGRGNYATKVIMVMAILMGLIILVYDHIHW